MFQHILLATDGSESAHKAEDYALYLGGACGAALTVLHVQEDRLCHYGHVDQLVPGETKEGFVNYVMAEQQETGDRILREFSRKAARRGVPYTFKMKQGVPADEIVATAMQEQVDLLIIGGGHAGWLKGFRCRGVADKVTAMVPCTVMTLS
ncbi:MAG: hypothetical protein BWK76_07685 [Desulfobulbaceae bacterium A2]|nr:MAG: hypothetical protein BWK76_07685 [Desulfobulbaceae bacterium A2]